jgi:hypothetical protein
VFKRRDQPSTMQRIGEIIYPKGGWRRAVWYMSHRVRRLPDSPERIARGIWAGVFTAFTPFYGVHFAIAYLIAKIMRANVIAALAATFFGNPLTYVPIGLISLQTGHWILGSKMSEATERSFGGKFVDAWRDLRYNAMTLFNDNTPDWDGLTVFYHEIFYPYMIGGLLPGVIVASVMYYLCVPLIRAYQKRRIARIRSKFAAIKQKAGAAADLSFKPD